MEFIGRNYNQLAQQIYAALDTYGEVTTSRNGPVKRLLGVTTMTVSCPQERVNTCPVRNANPFFHLVEAMAMLSGFNSVQLLSHYASNMAQYSDNGLTYNAFYGTRLRLTWGDQLRAVINELMSTPDSRQAVAQIWDPRDLKITTRDKACNLCLLFSVNSSGAVEMTSFNRSNDAIWGIVTGANVVHLSFFHEYVACHLRRPVGMWTHVSNNLHVYTENPQWPLMAKYNGPDIYSTPLGLFNAPLIAYGEEEVFDSALADAMSAILRSIATDSVIEPVDGPSFITKVLLPVAQTWYGWKHGFPIELLQKSLKRIESDDWRAACWAWIERACARRSRKEGTS